MRYKNILRLIYICTGIRGFYNLLSAETDNSTGYNFFISEYRRILPKPDQRTFLNDNKPGWLEDVLHPTVTMITHAISKSCGL